MAARKWSLLLCWHFAFCIWGFSQQVPKTASWRFHSINQAGLLEGEVGSAFQIQTINGIQHRTWFGGIGLGLDYYRFRGIPFFLDLRKAFSFSGKRFFVYADGGIHFPWPTDNEKGFSGNNFFNGFYTDIGLGYELIPLAKNSWILSLGYSYKKVAEGRVDAFCPMGGPCNVNRYRFDYELNRLSIKIGFAF
ncbi:MAG TPA: hypothetical protein VK543_12135 [Puia sp.]|nr:hypothetical protein [Puia sp.]